MASDCGTMEEPGQRESLDGKDLLCCPGELFVRRFRIGSFFAATSVEHIFFCSPAFQEVEVDVIASCDHLFISLIVTTYIE